MRHGHRRRRHPRDPAKARLSLQGGRDPQPRRRMPRLRPPRAGHGIRLRRRRGDPAPGGGRHRRGRPYLGHPQGHGDQQRRRRQGRLPRPLGGRAGAGDRRCAGHRRHPRRHDRLCGMPRHRHLSGRPDRDRRAQRGLSRDHRRDRLLPHRLRQDQYRPYRHRRRGGGADQDRAGAPPRPDPALARLREAQSGDPLRKLALPRQRPPHRLDQPSRPAPRRGQFAGRRRHQRPCGARRSPRRARERGERLAVPAADPLGAEQDGARCRRRAPRPAPARPPGAEPRRYRLDPAQGPARLRASPGPGRRKPRRGRPPARGKRPAPGLHPQRARRAAGNRLHVPRRGRATCGHGARPLRDRAGLCRMDGQGAGDPRPEARLRHPRALAARRRRRRPGRRRAPQAPLGAAAADHDHRICAGAALDQLGGRAAGPGRPLDGRKHRRLPRRSDELRRLHRPRPPSRHPDGQRAGGGDALGPAPGRRTARTYQPRA